MIGTLPDILPTSSPIFPNFSVIGADIGVGFPSDRLGRLSPTTYVRTCTTQLHCGSER
jgi:hypothetical protein